MSSTTIAAATVTMGVTIGAAFRAVWRRAVPRASEGTGRKSLSHNPKFSPHNAGVVGSSPTPAIVGESAQVASAAADSRPARFLLPGRSGSSVTTSVTTPPRNGAP